MDGGPEGGLESGLEGGVGELASLGVVLEHLVVEDGEVKGEAELDGVASGKINAVGLLVSGLGLSFHFFEESILGVLGNVAVVVTDHLDEESLSLGLAFSAEDASVDHVDDLLAVGHELGLDSSFVLKKGSVEFRVLGVRSTWGV